MKKRFFKALITAVTISLFVINAACATTVEGLLSEIIRQNSKTVTVANAQSFFGDYVASKEVELKDLITGTYYAYIPVEVSAIANYQASMETLGFIANTTELEDGVKQIIFDKKNARVLLIYSPKDSQLLLCYQEDIDFEPENDAEVVQTDHNNGPEEFAITHRPTVTAIPNEQPEVGYVDVEIDGTQYHFIQVSSKKSWTIMGKPTWDIRFVEKVRNEVRSVFYLNTSRSIMPGDTFGPKDILDLDFENDGVNSFTYFDKDNTVFILDEYRSFSIFIDTLDETEKGYEVTGRFNGTIYKDGVLKERENKRVKNGTFKFVMHKSDEEEVSY